MAFFRHRKYLLLSAIGIFIIASLFYSFVIEPGRLVVTEHTIEIEKLDPALDGLKIVAISDLHCGSNAVNAEKLRDLLALANGQNPDIVVLLGDFVSEYEGGTKLRMPLDEMTQNIRGLKARYGVFAVMGNHDDWYDSELVKNAVQAAGYRILDDEIATLDINNTKLRLLGLRDHLRINSWKAFSEQTRHLIDTDGGSGDIIVLEHSPDVLPMITGELSISPDTRLMLAGHTHGGQVWLPILGRPIIPSSYGQKYAYGHIRDQGLDMFVTSGVGTSILPFRFLVPPEIAVITLKRKAN
ncbi:MAG: metallophosphoesterase [Pyrinomonadaceae bacterium]